MQVMSNILDQGRHLMADSYISCGRVSCHLAHTITLGITQKLFASGVTKEA